MLTGASPEDAVHACEAIRARVEEHDWTSTAAGLRVTVSVGLGCLGAPAPATEGSGVEGTGAENGCPAAGALDRVDELLYVAKRTGRNAVAYRDAAGQVRLAGPASGRRGVDAVARAVCDPARSGRSGH